MDSGLVSRLNAAHAELEPTMRRLLGDALRIPSVSGDEAAFVRFIRDFAADAGMVTDLWETDEAELAGYEAAQSKHLPLKGRPTLVVGLPNPGAGRSLLFNAHSDVVGAGDPADWTFDPWSGTEDGGKFYGRGACDVKGSLVSALWAMLAIYRVCPRDWPGKVQLELVPGEEDCVTLGTLSSLVRGYQADACIVLEPTECQPRNASRSGLRFDITCSGRAVHGTVKWLGADAIALAHGVYACLGELESRWNDRGADALFSRYPIARPITVDKIQGGRWQGMVCDRCGVAGYLELFPGDEPAEWKSRFRAELRALLDRRGLNSRRVDVEFPESYLGHSLHAASSLCSSAESAVEVSLDLLLDASLRWNGWAGFNSGCEAGLRAKLQRTPTLVWGPGSLEQAHAVDEYVIWEHVHITAQRFERFAALWAYKKG
jgi:acetylornithine deacetylase